MVNITAITNYDKTVSKTTRFCHYILNCKSRQWLTVRFELGRDEVGSTEFRESRLAPDIIQLFDEMGLPEPEALPVLATEHQVAQKLHACTYISAKTGRNERAHDLVDLQLLDQEENINMAELHEVGTRLFASRRAQEWPPTILAYDGRNTLYSDAAEGLQVLPDVSAAIEWANNFITQSLKAKS